MQYILINIYELVQLEYRKNIEVFMQQKQFHLMEVHWLFYGVHQNIHHLEVHVFLWIDEKSVE
jgi:hypothetical protein